MAHATNLGTSPRVIVVMFDQPHVRTDREHRDRQPPLTPAPRPHPTPAQVLSLQRAAGNHAVTRLLGARGQPERTLARVDTPSTPPGPATPTIVEETPRVSYVFLMGDLSDAFYQRAKEHFERLLPPATIVADKRTLADVIGHVNAAGKPVDTLYIVSHGLESGTLMFSIDPADLAKDSGSGDARPRTELGELKAANGAGALPPADTSLIDVETKIEIKGCSVGRSELMLAELDVALGGKGSVTAPTHAQQFEPNDAGVFEETFGDLFIEEAGVAVKSDAELAAAFPTKYPMVPEDNWQALLQKVTTHNRSELRYRYAERNPPNDDETSVLADETVVAKFPASAGWVLTYKGRTTVGDQYHYEVVGERVREDGNTEWYGHVITASIPPEEAALIEQEKAKHARPDAYKWSVRRTVTGSQLTLEVFAEATEWTIGATIEDASGPHHPAHNDSTFFESSTATPPAPPSSPPAP